MSGSHKKDCDIWDKNLENETLTNLLSTLAEHPKMPSEAQSYNIHKSTHSHHTGYDS
jgi:hypothetical protein